MLPRPGGALHSPSTCGAEQQPTQRIRHCRFSAAHATGTTPRLHPETNSLRQLIRDQLFVRASIGCDPVGPIAPPHASLISRGDIIGVQKDLILLLLAPDTDTAVRRVVENGADRRMGPSTWVTMPVPCRVVLAR
ncbi:Uncharacterised protein [Mycobacteroides abscessus subsp. abscessus]|nr:Uncharacterised protein [Mycobacteroides abscessus subsp. abscessus]